jgi:hypothetical protein
MNYESENKLPNYVLTKAVSKLNTYGMDVFEMFCDEANIDFCDRNRCIAKCKMAYGREDLQEMACPDNLIQERWLFYTKKLSYNPKKAKAMLDLIDESYGKQFVPKLDKLVGQIFREVKGLE